MKRINFKIVIVGVLISFAFATKSFACTTKVSEWVLLNSVSEKHLLVYFHKNKLTENENQQNKELENRFKNTNLILKTMQSDELEKPYYGLYFNNRLILEFTDNRAIEKIVTSPLREKIISDLTNGRLCVMLYMKSGNSDKDEKGLEIINKTIKNSPFGNIISIVELDRNNADESLLKTMLLNVENDLDEIQEPMLYGIFGRFRALEPLLAKGISEENINLMIDFLTADCSCLIKDNLPGSSILCNSNWENPQPALVNTIFDANPELMHN